MKFKEYLDFLLDIGIKYNIYRRIPPIFFANCLGGDASAIIKDLDLLLNKPAKEFTQKDWAGVWWIIMRVKGEKNNAKMSKL